MSMKNIAKNIIAPLIIAVAIILPCAINSSAQEVSPAAWTPELSMQFRRIQGTATSSDGKFIAYVLSTPRTEGSNSEYRTQIWVATADGSRNIQYTQGEYSASSPAFSPDGQYLSFISKRGNDDDNMSQVWIMPLFGGEARQLTAAANNVLNYEWSPSGDRVVFSMQDPLSEEREKEIKEKRDVIIVDQQQRYRHLYVVAINESSDEPTTPIQITSGEMVVGNFSWNPDGEEVAFSHKPSDDLNYANYFGDISVVTIPTTNSVENFLKAETEQESESQKILGEIRILIAGNGVEEDPFWSPNGDWIAFTSSGSEPDLISRNDVYVIPALGGDSRMLAETPNRSANISGWSKDSDELYLTETMGTSRSIISLPLSGKEIRVMTPDRGVAGNLSLARNADRFTYSWESSDSPWNLFVQNTKDNISRQLTDLHSNVEIPLMGKTELISWTSPDGTEIEGLLTYPVDYREGTAYPIILNVHGGPSGVYSETFTGRPEIYMAQYFAQNNYAILRPNPRGSTGYGYEFRKATALNWGQGDLQDLLAGLDLVIEKGIGDVNNQFLMGWSYGGYMTSFAVTQTDRFNAASMGAGLSNLVSMSTTTDIRDYLIEHMGGYFWENPEVWEHSSAISHIENVVTPTQVIHGQEDFRVPLGQGQEFYNSLKWLGVDTEMIIYPRTPHGPREPKFLMDVSKRIMEWFGKYQVD